MTPPEARIQRLIEMGCMTKLKEECIVTYIYLCYKQWYYKGEPIVSDTAYDQYEDFLKREWPTNPALRVVGQMHPRCKCKTC